MSTKPKAATSTASKKPAASKATSKTKNDKAVNSTPKAPSKRKSVKTEETTSVVFTSRRVWPD